jgi:predicted RNase H-like HicB family nuclease
MEPSDQTVKYRVVLFESDEGWAVSCPDLKGCHSQGASRHEALQNIQQAIQLWIEVESEENGVKRVETTEVTI